MAAAVSGHVPQLITVPVDGVVVVQLDPAGAEPHTHTHTMFVQWWSFTELYILCAIALRKP